jgi:hypothetical protein
MSAVSLCSSDEILHLEQGADQINPLTPRRAHFASSFNWPSVKRAHFNARVADKSRTAETANADRLEVPAALKTVSAAMASAAVAALQLSVAHCEVKALLQIVHSRMFSQNILTVEHVKSDSVPPSSFTSFSWSVLTSSQVIVLGIQPAMVAVMVTSPATAVDL